VGAGAQKSGGAATLPAPPPPRSLNARKIFLELNSKRLYQNSGKEKESRCLVFTSSTQREIRHFHVVVMLRQQRNVQKTVMHVQSCCFTTINLLLFCRSCCECRHRCLSSLFPRTRATLYMSHSPSQFDVSSLNGAQQYDC